MSCHFEVHISDADRGQIAICIVFQGVGGHCGHDDGKICRKCAVQSTNEKILNSYEVSAMAMWLTSAVKFSGHT